MEKRELLRDFTQNKAKRGFNKKNKDLNDKRVSYIDERRWEETMDYMNRLLNSHKIQERTDGTCKVSLKEKAAAISAKNEGRMVSSSDKLPWETTIDNVERILNPHKTQKRMDGTCKVSPRDIAESTSGPKNEGRRVSHFDERQWKETMDYMDRLLDSHKRQKRINDLQRVSFDKRQREAMMDDMDRILNSPKRQKGTDGTCEMSPRDIAEATSVKNEGKTVPKVVPATTSAMMSPNVLPVSSPRRQNLPSTSSASRHNTIRILSVLSKSTRKHSLNTSPTVPNVVPATTSAMMSPNVSPVSSPRRQNIPSTSSASRHNTIRILSVPSKSTRKHSLDTSPTVPKVVPATTSSMMSPDVSPVSLHRRQNLPSTSSASRHNTRILTVPSESTRKHSLDTSPKTEYGTRIMCFTEESRLAFVPCGHVCLCETCFPRFKTVPKVVPATTSSMMSPDVSPVSLHRRQNLLSTSSASRDNIRIITVPSKSTRKLSLDTSPTVPKVVPATTSAMMSPNVSPVSLHRRQNLPSTSSASRHNTTILTVPSESTRKYSLDTSPKTEYGTCIMCFTKESRLAFVPCGHVCLCETCFPRFKVKFDRCAICQQNYSATLKIYLGGSCV